MEVVYLAYEVQFFKPFCQTRNFVAYDYERWRDSFRGRPWVLWESRRQRLRAGGLDIVAVLLKGNSISGGDVRDRFIPLMLDGVKANQNKQLSLLNSSEGRAKTRQADDWMVDACFVSLNRQPLKTTWNGNCKTLCNDTGDLHMDILMAIDSLYFFLSVLNATKYPLSLTHFTLLEIWGRIRKAEQK